MMDQNNYGLFGIFFFYGPIFLVHNFSKDGNHFNGNSLKRKKSGERSTSFLLRTISPVLRLSNLPSGQNKDCSTFFCFLIQEQNKVKMEFALFPDFAK